VVAVAVVVAAIVVAPDRVVGVGEVVAAATVVVWIVGIERLAGRGVFETYIAAAASNTRKAAKMKTVFLLLPSLFDFSFLFAFAILFT
jgi:uncharacterized membrane protein YecN with MAPEG domain